MIAQRLVRKVCDGCAEPRPMTEAEAKPLGITDFQNVAVARDVGAQLVARPDIVVEWQSANYCWSMSQFAKKSRIARATEIRDMACQGGMKLLRDDGIAKILAGVTTPSEVERVTVRTSL